MTIVNFDDFKKGGGGERKDPMQEREEKITVLKQLHQAELLADILTGSEDWDNFLSYVNGQKEQITGTKLYLQEQLIHPQMVNEEQIRMVRQALHVCQGQISMLDWVMLLPKALKEGGAGAKAILQGMESDGEDQQYRFAEIGDWAAPPV